MGSVPCTAEKAKVTKLTAQTKTLKEELGTSQAQAEKLQSELSSTESKAKQTQSKLEKLERELKDAKLKSSQLEEQFQAQKIQFRELEDLLEKEQTKSKQLLIKAQDCTGGKLSIIDAVSMTGSIANDMVQHLLNQTDIDEQIVDVVSKQVGVAKELTATATEFTWSVADQVASVDYMGHVQNLTSHDFYKTNIAPHVETISTGAQPLVNDYVKPGMEYAKVYINPAMETAMSTYDVAAKTMQSDVLPVLMQGTNQAYGHVAVAVSDAPMHFAFIKARLGDFIEPIFKAVHKAAPRHQQSLPKHPVDRVLFLVLLAVALYYLIRVSSRVSWTSLRVVVRVVGKLFVILYHSIIIPLKILSKTLGLTICCATGFYCCRLCRRRRKKAEKNGVHANGKANGKVDTKSASKDAKTTKAEPAKDDKANQVTAKEISALLDKAKAKGKLAEGVKQLLKTAKDGKTLTTPKELEGKRVPKDLLKQVAGRYKELDLKSLGF